MTDNSTAASFPSGHARGDTATDALVSFLRMEADLAEEKARKLRAQATAMALQFGVSEETQGAYGEYIQLNSNAAVLSSRDV
jgi:hypothetical protein